VNAKGEVKRGLEIMTGIKLLDREDVRDLPWAAGSIYDGVVESDGRLKPEVHFFPVKEVMGSVWSRIGVVTQKAIQLGQILWEEFNLAQERRKLLGNGQRIRLVLIGSKSSVSVLLICSQQPDHAALGTIVGLLNNVRGSPVDGVPGSFH